MNRPIDAIDALVFVALVAGTAAGAVAALGTGMVLVLALRIAIDWVGPLLLLGALLTPLWLWLQHRRQVRAQRRQVRQLDAAYQAPSATKEQP